MTNEGRASALLRVRTSSSLHVRTIIASSHVATLRAMNHDRFAFDLVVVGASFAGAACALAAAQSGLRVCVLERKRDPGEKLRTTGIIVKEAAERTLLGALPSELVRRVEQVRLYAPSLKQIALAAPGCYFLTTDTPGVMRWLAAQMRSHGVDLRLSTSFRNAH